MSAGTRWSVICLVCSLALVYGVSRLVRDVQSETIVFTDRFHAMLANLDKITEHPQNTSLFIGHSIFQLFLDPEAYDSEMRKIGQDSTSYNLAMAGHMGLPSLAFVQRFHSELAPKTKFRETIFEISPVSYAKHFHDSNAYMMDVERPGIYLSRKMWPSFFRNDPELALNVFFNSILHPFDWTAIPPFKHWLGLTWNFWALAMPNVAYQPPFVEDPAWRLEAKGLSNWNLPKERLAFENLEMYFRNPTHWERMMKTYIDAHALNDRFRMDEDGIQALVATLKDTREFSSHVYGVLVPYEPEYQALAEKYADYDGFIKRVAHESGITILDLRKDFHVTTNDFEDAMHMKRTSWNRLLTLVAERIHGPNGIESSSRESADRSFRSVSAEVR